jgi:hypothetical protein
MDMLDRVDLYRLCLVTTPLQGVHDYKPTVDELAHIGDSFVLLRPAIDHLEQALKVGTTVGQIR